MREYQGVPIQHIPEGVSGRAKRKKVSIETVNRRRGEKLEKKFQDARDEHWNMTGGKKPTADEQLQGTPAIPTILDK